MDTSLLEEQGLTNTEAKIYIANLELGSATAGQILNRAQLHNSVVHAALPKLVNKGFLSYILVGNVKHYSATDPENIIKIIDEKKKRFEDFVPELKLRQKKEEKQSAEIYEGFRGFKTANEEFVKDLSKGDEYYFFSINPPNSEEFKQVFNFFKHFDNEQEAKGLIVKGISPADLKNNFEGRNQETLLFVDFPVPENITFSKDKVLLNSFDETGKQTSFMIHSKTLAKSFMKYFDSIWNKRKSS